MKNLEILGIDQISWNYRKDVRKTYTNFTFGALFVICVKL